MCTFHQRPVATMCCWPMAAGGSLSRASKGRIASSGTIDRTRYVRRWSRPLTTRSSSRKVMCGAAGDANFETTKATQSKTSCILGLTEGASFTDDRVALLLVSFGSSSTTRCQIHESIQRVARLQPMSRRGTASIRRYNNGSSSWLPIAPPRRGSYKRLFDEAVGDDFSTVVLLVNLSEHSMLKVPKLVSYDS